MSQTVREGALEIHFPNALSCIKFDKEGHEGDFHGMSHCMKAVDFVAELPASWLFVEVKDFLLEKNETDVQAKCQDLAWKFKDTFLYRWAEGKLDKPVEYYCIIEGLEAPMLLQFLEQIKQRLPLKKPANGRWKYSPIHNLLVLNTQTKCPECQVCRKQKHL